MNNANTNEALRNSIDIKVVKSNGKKFDEAISDVILSGLIICYYYDMMHYDEMVEIYDKYLSDHKDYSKDGITYEEMLLTLCCTRRFADLRMHAISRFIELKREYDRREIVCKGSKSDMYILSIDVADVSFM